MRANKIASEMNGNHPRARVGVIASQIVTQQIQSALQEANFSDTEIRALIWPDISPAAMTGTQLHAPELIVCEIYDSAQAADTHRQIGLYWPEATLISCELGALADNSEEGAPLLAASQQAGYQGHLRIDEVALQLPIFLRYAEQRRVADQQSRQLLQLTNLLSAASRMHASLDQQQIAEEILGEFGKWVNADSWQLYVLSDNGKFIELISSEGARLRPPSLTLRADGKGLIEQVLQKGEMVVMQQRDLQHTTRQGDSRTNRTDEALQDGAVLCFPLKVGQQVIGVSQATRIEKTATFSRDEQSALQEVSSIASLALHNAVQFARAERLYMQDDLTQLHNSRYLRQYIEAEFKRVKRYGGEVAVIFIDLDGFKGVNDRFGHRVGSETLKEAAHLLMDSVRDTDVVTRYGGDEFTIVMPNTDSERAYISAERVRQRIAAHNFQGGNENIFHLTASFGIAAFPEYPAESAVDLLEKADLAMYAAKAANKNNVKLAKL